MPSRSASVGQYIRPPLDDLDGVVDAFDDAGIERMAATRSPRSAFTNSELAIQSGTVAAPKRTVEIKEADVQRQTIFGRCAGALIRRLPSAMWPTAKRAAVSASDSDCARIGLSSTTSTRMGIPVSKRQAGALHDPFPRDSSRKHLPARSSSRL